MTKIGSRPRRLAPRLALLFLSAPPPGHRPPLVARALGSESNKRSASATSSLGHHSSFRTVIPIEPLGRTPHRSPLSYSDPLFFVGSCFSDNVGSLAASAKLPVLRNPFGVQYNGSSMARSLRRIADGESYRLDELGRHPSSGMWYSLDHHSRYNNKDADACLCAINRDLVEARDFLTECRRAYVTLGSAYVFDATSPHLRPLSAVANCHKLAPKMFVRRLQSIEEVRDALVSCHRSLSDLNPDVLVTFTVSPVRHWKDGPINNSRSKAHLLAAVHQAVERINRDCSTGPGSGPADYFPSYEILMDELRDYRFYDTDMLHPSRVAIEYIWERLLDAHFDRVGLDGVAVDDVMKRVKDVERALAHRPFDPEGEPYTMFLSKQLEEIKVLEHDFPSMDFSRELEEVMRRLGGG